jgi:cyclopropane fatty-acyl-phospholipid synthase-like methyltransferase
VLSAAFCSFTSLLGVDYVEASVELSRAVAAAAGVTCARFQLDDVLDSALPSAGFDLVCDKGTFDAVGLAADGAEARVRYLATSARLLPPGGLLVLTSCNSTADELAEELTAGGAFAEIDRVKTYPRFRFGGVEGTRVCTVAFRRTAS